MEMFLSLPPDRLEEFATYGETRLTYATAPIDLKEAEANGLIGIGRLPFSLKVLLENLLRHENGRSIQTDDLKAVGAWLQRRRSMATPNLKVWAPMVRVRLLVREKASSRW